MSKKDPFRIFSIEVYNLNTTGMFCGNPVPKGCLGIWVDRKPELIYEQIGNCFVAHDNGIVRHYTYQPGTTDGFAGQKTTLPVIGQGTVFKNRGVTRKVFSGSLWDSVEGAKAAEKLIGERLYNVGLKSGNQQCYTHYMATESLVSRISGIVILGNQEQSPLI